MKKHLRPAHLAALLAACALSLALAPAAPAQTADPFAALPADSEVVLVIDAQKIMNEVVPRVLASDQKTLVQMNTAIDGATALSGVNLRSIRRVVAGVKGLSPNMKPDQLRGVVVIEGVDTAKLIAFARSAAQGKFTEADYQGTTVFTPMTDNNKPINPLIEVAALDATTIVAGTPAELRAGLDLGLGRATRAATDAGLGAAAARHAGALASMAFLVPDSMKQLIANSGTDPKQGGNAAGQMIATALSAVKSMSAAVTLVPTGYDSFFGARLDTGERAKSLADMIEGFKKLALMEAPKNEQDRLMHEVVRATQVTAQGEEVQVRSLVTQATVDAFMKLNQKPATQAQPLRKAPARRPVTRARRRPRA